MLKVERMSQEECQVGRDDTLSIFYVAACGAQVKIRLVSFCLSTTLCTKWGERMYEKFYSPFLRQS